MFDTPVEQRTPTQRLTSTNDEHPLRSPYMLTTQDCILLLIGTVLMLQRRLAEPFLPIQLGLLGDVVPPDCLIWSFLIGKTAVRDVLHVWRSMG